jgi:hypothetical protein
MPVSLKTACQPLECDTTEKTRPTASPSLGSLYPRESRPGDSGTSALTPVPSRSTPRDGCFLA